jgi:hypothetical protein
MRFLQPNLLMFEDFIETLLTFPDCYYNKKLYVCHVKVNFSLKSWWHRTSASICVSDIAEQTIIRLDFTPPQNQFDVIKWVLRNKRRRSNNKLERWTLASELKQTNKSIKLLAAITPRRLIRFLFSLGWDSMARNMINLVSCRNLIAQCYLLSSRLNFNPAPRNSPARL